jgi:magnesium-transporting ATPase (P-type)
MHKNKCSEEHITIGEPDLMRTALYKDMKRIGQVLGIFSTLGALILWIISLWYNPYSPAPLTLPLLGMMALALLGLLAASLARPLVMVFIFVFSFVPVGLYMLGTPGIFKWIGIFNLLYGTAGLILLIHQWQLKRGKEERTLMRII